MIEQRHTSPVWPEEPIFRSVCPLRANAKMYTYIGIARKTDEPRFRAGTIPACVCCATDNFLWQTTFLQQLIGMVKLSFSC